jgi:hypothetical protein
MSNREDNLGLRDSHDGNLQQSFSFSNTKNRINNTAGGKNSSSKKGGKSSKVFFQKPAEINEKAQIKTPQSQAARTRKGVAVRKLI